MALKLFAPTLEDNDLKAITIPGWAERFNQRMGLPSANGELYKDSTWARRCIDLRASSLSNIPWGVRIGEDEDEQFLGNDSRLVRLLKDVNDEMNWVDLIRATSKDLDIEGRAYWEKIFAGSRVVGLMRLNPTTMKNVTDSREGLTGFKQDLPESPGAPRSLERDEVVYFHDFHPQDDLGGLGKIETAKESIKADIAATVYLQSFFKNGAIPAMILRTEQSVGEAELKRRKRLWDRWFGGVKKALKTAFLDRGLEAQVVGLNVEQLAMEQVRSEARKDICAAFGVPPAIAGAWESATYNATPEQRKSFHEDSIFPDATYIASVMNAELIRPHFGENLAFEWLFGELPFMREDMNDKGQMLARAVEVGALTPEGFAAQMGIDEQFVGPGKQPVPSFEPREEDEEPEVEAPSENGAASSRSRVEEIKAIMAEVQKSRPMLEKDEIGDVEADLRRWRRKALKRLSEGKAAHCTFDSEHIPETLNVAIEELLKGAESPDDVHSIFHEAVLWREREPIYGGPTDQDHGPPRP